MLKQKMKSFKIILDMWNAFVFLVSLATLILCISPFMAKAVVDSKAQVQEGLLQVGVIGIICIVIIIIFGIAALVLLIISLVKISSFLNDPEMNSYVPAELKADYIKLLNKIRIWLFISFVYLIPFVGPIVSIASGLIAWSNFAKIIGPKSIFINK